MVNRNPDLVELLQTALKGHTQAIDMLWDILDTLHIYDDLIDGDLS